MMALKVNDLSVGDVVKILESWEMKEFVDFVREKEISGRKFMDTSEGLVKIWRPDSDAKNFISFIQRLKQDPDKYLKCLNDDVITIKETNLCSESQYQTVSVRKISQQDKDSNNTNRVEEILKKITAPKSFLYRYQNKRQERSVTSYVPMNASSERKTKKFFRLSSYDYPIFDLKTRFSKNDCTDRGYYPISKTSKETNVRPKYNSMNSTEEFTDKLSEDHFYEDLCYTDVKEEKKDKEFVPIQSNQVKPCMVKIQELFQLFKLPFFKRNEEVQKIQNGAKNVSVEKENNIYENTSIDMYDSIHIASEQDSTAKDLKPTSLAVEDYMEPVQVSKDYCDVCLKKDESLLGYIMNYFETHFGMRRVSASYGEHVVRVGNTTFVDTFS